MRPGTARGPTDSILFTIQETDERRAASIDIETLIHMDGAQHRTYRAITNDRFKSPRLRKDFQMSDLSGKVCVITGGASGIGAGTARLFHERGARIVVADVQEEAGERIAVEVDGVFVRTDVTREDDVRASVDRAVSEWGRLDCMFNNAGFGGALGPIDETSEADFDITFDVLVKGVFFGIKHAARVMKEQRSGSILNTASVAAIRAGYSPHLYGAAKAAVIALTRTTAVELADYGVRVNSILPGLIATPLASGVTDEEAMAGFREQLAAEQPIGRVGEPRDIAEVAAFLASDASSFVTGQEHVVDGGFSVGRPWKQWPRWMTRTRPITVHRPPGR